MQGSIATVAPAVERTATIPVPSVVKEAGEREEDEEEKEEDEEEGEKGPWALGTARLGG